MHENGLQTYTDAAREFDVHPRTIGDVVKLLGITPKPMTNGKAKGLDRSDMRRLRRAFGLGRRARTASGTMSAR